MMGRDQNLTNTGSTAVNGRITDGTYSYFNEYLFNYEVSSPDCKKATPILI